MLPPISTLLLYLIGAPILGLIIFIPSILTIFFGIFFASFLLLLLPTFWFWKKKKINQFLLCSIWIAIWQYSSFLSNVLSFKKFKEGEAPYLWGSGLDQQYPSIGSAGFPITSHQPSPFALGSDIPPQEMWLNIFANHGIWFIIAFIVALLLTKILSKKDTQTKSKIAFVFICFAFLGYFSSIGYYLIAFD